VTRLHKL